MKKKLLALILACVMMFVVGSQAFAADGEYIDDFNLEAMAPLSSATIKAISNIPVYITFLKVDNETAMEKAQQQASDKISASIANEKSSLAKSFEGGLGTAISEDSDFDIVRVSDNGINDLYSNILYKETFLAVQESLEAGLSVNFINLYMYEANGSYNKFSYNARASAYDQDDPEYWEQQCPSLGTYGGYKFLYMESSWNVESSWVIPGSLGSLNWTVIIEKSIRSLLDHFVKNVYYKTVKTVESLIKTALGSYTPPYSVTYSQSSGYLKTEVSGDLYLRQILIRDDDDKIAGYAYYPWGTTERFVATQKFDIKYPTSKNISGTYEYATRAVTGSTTSSYTPGFYGNSTLYQSIINFYNHTYAYATHDEEIRVDTLIADIIG